MGICSSSREKQEQFSIDEFQIYYMIEPLDRQMDQMIKDIEEDMQKLKVEELLQQQARNGQIQARQL
ncbi:hypothetical protein pb186bvf_000200 [Paramecium bursaria]